MMHLIINTALIVSFLLSSHDAFTPSCAIRHHDIVVRNSKRVNDIDDIVGMAKSDVKEFLLFAATAIAVAVAPVPPVSAASYSDINRCKCLRCCDSLSVYRFVQCLI